MYNLRTLILRNAFHLFIGLVLGQAYRREPPWSPWLGPFVSFGLNHGWEEYSRGQKTQFVGYFWTPFGVPRGKVITGDGTVGTYADSAGVTHRASSGPRVSGRLENVAHGESSGAGFWGEVAHQPIITAPRSLGYSETVRRHLRVINVYRL